MEPSEQCSWCGGQLRQGFLEDKSADGGSRILSWIDGPGRKGPFGGAKVLGKRRYDVAAYLCNNCGHLDLFVLG